MPSRGINRFSLGSGLRYAPEILSAVHLKSVLELVSPPSLCDLGGSGSDYDSLEPPHGRVHVGQRRRSVCRLHCFLLGDKQCGFGGAWSLSGSQPGAGAQVDLPVAVVCLIY